MFCRNDSADSNSSHIVFQNSGNSLESEVSDGVKDLNKSPTSSPVRLKGRNIILMIWGTLIITVKIISNDNYRRAHIETVPSTVCPD